jgi:hypothetical protein
MNPGGKIMTNSTAIFLPMIAQVLLTYAIYLLISSRRIGAIRAGKAKASDFKVPVIEPESSATAARNLVNQFELPVLFYIACLSLYVTGGAGMAAILISWAFVLVRMAHAYVHVTSNRVGLRRRLFIASFMINLCQWGLLVVHIL